MHHPGIFRTNIILERGAAMEELLKALHTIQDECRSHEDDGCKRCLLYSLSGACCGVTDIHPDNWLINDTPMKLLL